MKPLDSMTGRGCCGKSLRFVAAGLVTLAVVHVAHWISSETSSILREESQAQFSLHNLPSKRVVMERSKIQTVTRGSLRNSFRQMQEIHVKPAIPHAKILNITSFSGVDQDDPRLVAYVRQRMRSPAPSSQPYNLMHPEKTDFSQSNQSTYADREFLHGMTNGFFVEMGAVDGEIFSNSLYFERTLNWTGLLVEANPEDYHTLTTRGRKAYSIHAAVSPKNTSGMSTFNRRSQLFGRLGPDEGTGVAVWRFPLYTMLAALNVSTVDFLSLDVEGDELEQWHI